MKSIFVTGTDTQVGKTVITGLLARYLLELNLNVITQKWIESGGNDLKTHFKLMGKRLDIPRERLCPYSFKFPASPHLSAEIEHKKIEPELIKKSFLFLKKRYDIVLVEGTGGLFTPIREDRLLIDIAKELSLPVLLVSKNRLGTINHSLLTIEALRMKKMRIMGIVFNNPPKGKKEILEDNPKIIKALAKIEVFGVLPYIKDKETLYKAFIPIAEKIKDGLD